ncbi:MAG: hypothetical protein AAGK78_12885, partial [Planctomycetota bacterium]
MSLSPDIGMTREAKIGLIVALAFLLVIGMLLSDHVTVANEETRADLTNTAGNIGAGIATPGQIDQGRRIPVPVLPTPTRGPEDHVYRPTNVQNTNAGGSTMQPIESPIFSGEQADNQSNTDTGVLIPPTTLTGEDYDNIARNNPQDVEFQPIQQNPVPGQNGGDRIANAPQPDVVDTRESQPQAGVAVIDYVAKPGDSVSKITAKVFGRWTPANQQKLAALNPVWKNSDKVVAG